MSINLETPETPLEKIDAASNLVEQMFLAHMIKDEATFKNAHQRAGKLLFEAMRQIEKEESKK